MPVGVVRAVRLIAADSSQLVAHLQPSDGALLSDRALATSLDGVELGAWTLGPRSLELLFALVSDLSPTLVIEFGSGASTVVMATAMERLGRPGGAPSILSLEQDLGHAERTRALLDKAGLGGVAQVVDAALGEQSVEGQTTTCYVVPQEFESLVAGRKAELVVIDGPVGRPGVRFGTLPLVARFAAKDSQFVLDDAMRDGELDIAARWHRLTYVHADGIRLIEKGLLTGTIRGR